MKLAPFLLLLPLVLVGCETPPQPPIKPVPAIRPKPRPQKPSVSAESQRLAAYYASQEARLLQQGKLRKDFAPADAPYTVDDLVQHFRKIALYDEYLPNSKELVAQETVSSLRRWRKPIRLATVFGKNISKKQRQQDINEVTSFARRLSGITRVPFNFSSVKNANFIVAFLNRDELLTEPTKLAVQAPNLFSKEVIYGIETLPDEVNCIVYGHTSATPPYEYLGAVVVIKSEHSPLLRQSCIHEEMAQGMGLANDDPNVRPSIFNDDEEFALLTQHDEKLLKMLYDPVLKLGMTPSAADSILRQAAQNAMKQNQL